MKRLKKIWFFLEVNWKKVDILANIDGDYNEAKYLEVEIVKKKKKNSKILMISSKIIAYLILLLF